MGPAVRSVSVRDSVRDLGLPETTDGLALGYVIIEAFEESQEQPIPAIVGDYIQVDVVNNFASGGSLPDGGCVAWSRSGEFRHTRQAPSTASNPDGNWVSSVSKRNHRVDSQKAVKG